MQDPKDSDTGQDWFQQKEKEYDIIAVVEALAVLVTLVCPMITETHADINLGHLIPHCG